MKTSSDLKKIKEKSLFTGLISLALFGPIVGLKTSSKGEGLFVTPHVGIVVLLVLACVAGRFLIGLNSLRKKEINFIANITSSISKYMDNKSLFSQQVFYLQLFFHFYHSQIDTS